MYNIKHKARFVLREHRKKVCDECSSEYRVHAHHMNTNPRYNVLGNLRWLCASCHRKIHNVNYNFKRVLSRRRIKTLSHDFFGQQL
jgi:hypothetical protein